MIGIIGATGNTGGHAAVRLLAQGQNVRAVVRDPSRASSLESGGAKVVTADATDVPRLTQALWGVDQLLVATPAEPRLPEIHRGIWAAAKNAGVRAVVKISAINASSEAKLRFASVHGESDADLKSSGIAYTILQPTFFMQNFLGQAAQIAAGRLEVPMGDAGVSFVDSRDVASAAVSALTHDGHLGRVYTLTGPSAVTGREAAEIFSRVLGREVTYIDPGRDEYVKAMIAYGVPEWLAEGVGEGCEMWAAGAAAQVADGVQELTGRPATAFEQFVRDHAPVIRA